MPPRPGVRGACRDASAAVAQPPLSRRTWLRRLSLSAMVIAGLPACDFRTPPALKIGLNSWVGYDPLVLARERQRLDVRRVKVIELASVSETLRHLHNGLLEGAALTLDETLRQVEQGEDLRIVEFLSTSHGADVVLASPSIERPTQLRGQRIAVESSTVGALMLHRLLQSAGLTLSDVLVVPLESSQHLAALRDGRVTVAVSHEPLARHMRAAGFWPMFDSRQMPGEIIDVLVVRAATLDQRPEQVQALVAGWQRGLQEFQADPAKAAELLAPGVALSEADYQATLSGLRFYTPGESLGLLGGRGPAETLQAGKLVETLRGLRLLHHVPVWDHLLAPAPALQVSRSAMGGAP